jgi:hypothetical protein
MSGGIPTGVKVSVAKSLKTKNWNFFLIILRC